MVNRLMPGPNLDILKSMEAGSVDLIYLDLLSFSRRNYEVGAGARLPFTPNPRPTRSKNPWTLTVCVMRGSLTGRSGFSGGLFQVEIQTQYPGKVQLGPQRPRETCALCGCLWKRHGRDRAVERNSQHCRAVIRAKPV